MSVYGILRLGGLNPTIADALRTYLTTRNPPAIT